MPLEGQRIGRYRLLHAIGCGGMGEVYLAADTLIKRQGAIKIIRAEDSSYPHHAAPQEAARLFFREARTIAVLSTILTFFLYVNHTHITDVIDDTYSHGQVGVAASTADLPPVEVVFTNAKVWKL